MRDQSMVGVGDMRVRVKREPEAFNIRQGQASNEEVQRNGITAHCDSIFQDQAHIHS